MLSEQDIVNIRLAFNIAIKHTEDSLAAAKVLEPILEKIEKLTEHSSASEP